MKSFQELKSRILLKYKKALHDGLVDEGMIPINTSINQIQGAVTTSSCTGRITLISKSALRSKYHTKFHFKSHNPQHNDFPEVAEIEFDSELWFLMESPNIHVKCEDGEIAKNIVSKALEAKLGKSKFQSLSENPVVEILGTSSLQVPIGEGGAVLVDPDYILYLVNKGNSILRTEQMRLSIFHELIQEENKGSSSSK